MDQYIHQEKISASTTKWKLLLKSRWKGLLQITVGVGALILVLRKTDIAHAWEILCQVDPKLLLLALLLNLLMTWVMALRWKWLLAVKYPKFSDFELFKHYLVALFFNLFTPGAVGGDLSRLVSIGAVTKDRNFVLATLVMERLTGLCGLLLAGLSGVWFGRHYLTNTGTYYLVALMMMVGLLLSTIIFNQRIMKFVITQLYKIEIMLGKKVFAEAISRLIEHLQLFRTEQKLILVAIISTVAIRVIWVLSCWTVAYALDLTIPFSLLMAFISIVDIARMVPVSLPNGLGVREYLLALLLKQIGVVETRAVLFSFIAYTLLMVNGLWGGIIYTAQGVVRKKE